MLSERGVVVEDAGGEVRVRVTRSAMCADCASKGSCHALSGAPNAVVSARNEAGARVGDLVEVCLPEAALLGASALLYLVPVLGLVLGAVVGDLLWADSLGPNGGPGLGALLGLVVCFAVVGFVSRHRRLGAKFKPVVTKVVLRHLGPDVPEGLR